MLILSICMTLMFLLLMVALSGCLMYIVDKHIFNGLFVRKLQKWAFTKFPE